MRNALRTHILPRLYLFAALVLGVLFLARDARASGTVTVVNREPTEIDGRWKLNMTIDFGSIPKLAHIPVIFSFTPTVLYERSLTDKSPEKPVIIRMPLQNQQAINESLDIGFSDASGKIFKVTKFDVVIRRDHGFEAGEYDLKIKREDDGVQLGQVIRLVLKGDNPVVDRRAIVFAGDKKKKVDGDKPADKAADKPADGDKPADKPADEAKPEDKPTDPAAPPAVPPKQGGCGCRVAGDTAPEGALVALALAAAVCARRSRRRRAA